MTTLGQCSNATGGDGGTASDGGITYVKSDITQASQAFGRALALSADGNTLAVGSPAQGSGAVSIFVRAGGVWTWQTSITASNAEHGDEFGDSVALNEDGSMLAIGSPGESSNATGINGSQADNSAADSGAVYIFVRTGTAWTQQTYIKASSTGAGDQFGRTVSMNKMGTLLVVGAPEEASSAIGINGNQSDNSLTRAGAAYAFSRTGTTWSQIAYLKPSLAKSNALFGGSLAVSGDGSSIAVVGDGLVHAFRAVGASVVGAGTIIGCPMCINSVALSDNGDTLAAGSTIDSSNATGIDGNRSDTSAPYAGAVWLMTRAGSTWSAPVYVKASNTEADDYFGNRVMLNGGGNILVVSAQGEDSNARGLNGNQADNSASGAGGVYAFSMTGGVWKQQDYIKASNTDANDAFGWDIALSSAGNILAVGAPQESSNATGIGGNQNDNSAHFNGAVYVFTR